MRISFWSGVGLLSLSLGAFAAPAADSADVSSKANLVAKRAPVDQATAITCDLLGEIKVHTAKISMSI